MRNFISVNQLTEQEIYHVLGRAESYRRKNETIREQIFAANLFFEPSTRTKMSFMIAQKKLGLEVLDFHSESSSVLKGESLYDTAKTFEAIGANLLVVRHESDDWTDELIGKLNIPVINAGAGKKEHPTQSMLDLLTIYEEFGRLKGLKVAIAGDIKHSRVAHSNAIALKNLGAKVILSAAPGFEDHHLEFPYVSMDEAVESCDVLMLLRIQHERHTDRTETEWYLNSFGLTKEREKRMHQHAIILHPAPINRGVEIDTELVECKRSRIFRQMSNGVYIRMAIIMEVLEEWGMLHENCFNQRKALATVQ